jgi:hypothetical protein
VNRNPRLLLERIRRFPRSLMYGIDHLLRTESGVLAVYIPCLIVILAFLPFDLMTMAEIQEEKLQEKFTDYSGRIDQICSDLDGYSASVDSPDADYYLGVYEWNIEYMDGLDMTFAALYDDDLRTVTERDESYAGSPFDPTVYPSFVGEVKNGDPFGTATLSFTPDGATARDMHVYWRWTDLDGQERQYLLVIAISKYTVSTETADWIGAVSILRDLFLLFIVFTFTSYVNHIGKQYQARTEER